MSRFSAVALACTVILALASCDHRDPPASAAKDVGGAVAAPEPFVAPRDVFEHDARAIVGITYPPGLERYPALAKLLLAHSDAPRAPFASARATAPDDYSKL